MHWPDGPEEFTPRVFGDAARHRAVRDRMSATLVRWDQSEDIFDLVSLLVNMPLVMAGCGACTAMVTASAIYAAQARAKARACSPGKVPLADVTSSRVCLPPSSSINENSHCASGGLIVTVRRSRKSVIRN